MEKYTSVSEKTKPENKDKIIISDDYFAIAEMIEKLLKKIDAVSMRIKNGR